MLPENKIIQSLWLGGELTCMERACARSFLAQGHEFHLYLYGPQSGIPEGVTIRDAEQIMPRAEAAKYRSLANFSDVFRYRLIQRTRVPWWVDLDVFCLRPFDFPDPYVFASEMTYAHIAVNALVNGCVLKAPPDSTLLRVALERCAAQNPERPAGKLIGGMLAFGPELLTNLARELNLTPYVQASGVFNPVTVPQTPAKFLDPAGFDVGAAHAAHMFHSCWAKRGYAPGPAGCLYNRLLGLHAPQRTLIAVVTCAQNRARVEAMERTWLPVARAAGYDVEIFDGARLGLPDGYGFMPFRAQGIFRYALQRGYDYLLKCDDDTFVRVPELGGLPLHVYDYAGARCPANQYGRPDGGRVGFPYEHFPLQYPPATFPHDYAQGGVAWFSRRAFSIMAQAPLNGDWADDRWVGHVLAGAGVKFINLAEFLFFGRSLAHPTTPWHPAWAAVTQCPSPETLDQLQANPLAFCTRPTTPIPAPRGAVNVHPQHCRCTFCRGAH